MTSLTSLRRLAALYGIQVRYFDGFKERREVAPDTLMAILRATGAPLATFAEADGALRERQLESWRRGIEPVLLAPEGELGSVNLRLPASLAGTAVEVTLDCETGDPVRLRTGLAGRRRVDVEGQAFAEGALRLGWRVEPGYHRLRVRSGRFEAEAVVIAGPGRTWRGDGRRAWGLFLPLYALRSAGDWGAGSYTDLGRLAAWIASLGGSYVATLPLLASVFGSNTGDVSPYSPVSRLMWSEFFIDPAATPEFARSAAAREMVNSADFASRIASSQGRPLVDYGETGALRRRIIELLAEEVCAGGPRLKALSAFLARRPEVERYATFRATWERQGRGWREWPERLRAGLLRPDDCDERARRTFLYAQWLAHEQVEGVASEAAARGAALYLDLPLGVHPHGFDAWSERGLFAEGVTAGAPPDGFFRKGQDWGFHPVLPEAQRSDGYRYLARVLRHHMSVAGALRLDHVMGLHRLFWIPKGAEPREGTYVRYPAQEAYAVLALESHRTGTRVFGEDLGTVPRYVGPAMRRHGVGQMYVAEYEVRGEKAGSLGRVPRGAVAAVATHDMPPFAGWWRGVDIERRVRLGLLPAAEAADEREGRGWTRRTVIEYLRREGFHGDGVDAASVLQALLHFLAASEAELVLMNLEDLWLETEPQNVPGTSQEEPNWRRRAACTIEEAREMPVVVGALREVDRARRASRP